MSRRKSSYARLYQRITSHALRPNTVVSCLQFQRTRYVSLWVTVTCEYVFFIF